MFSALNKKLLWVIMIWFAILQAISPLIHGHIESDAYKLEPHGIHLHIQEIVPAYDQTPSLKNATDTLHTIGIDKALVKNVLLLPAPLFSVLFILAALLVLRHSRIPRFNFSAYHPLYLRPQSSPRAPPLL